MYPDIFMPERDDFGHRRHRLNSAEHYNIQLFKGIADPKMNFRSPYAHPHLYDFLSSEEKNVFHTMELNGDQSLLNSKKTKSGTKYDSLVTVL